MADQRPGEQPPSLPDEKPTSGGIGFSTGAMDGIATHHFGPEPESRRADAVSLALGALLRLGKRPDDEEGHADLYQAWLEHASPFAADQLLEALQRQTRLNRTDLLPHARWLVHSAPDRGPLVLGIVLLGVCGEPRDIPDLKLLARHDDLTLYALTAIVNLLDRPVDAVWEISRSVHGWGRVHAVERLADMAAGRSDIQAWLLREGWRNQVMNEYLAYKCAVAGGLLAAITEAQVDDALLDGACGITGALLRGGPAEDMKDYADGVPVVRSLVGLLATRTDGLRRLEIVVDLHRWLEWPHPPPPPEHLRYLWEQTDRPQTDRWEPLRPSGWTDAVRSELADACQAILTNPTWPARVAAAFSSDDEPLRYLAWSVARAVKVDLWERAFAYLQQDPLESYWYYQLMRTDELVRCARVLAFGAEHLPLAEIASGPRMERGLGPAFKPHLCLGFLLQEQQRAPLFNADLIAAGLRSPVIANRNAAIRAILAHLKLTRRTPLEATLARAGQAEPDEEVRGRMQEALKRLEQLPS